ncbi:MAG: tetratricopeptide repeat protein [Candidatus Krumholzibacteriota bacterium]|nr:tetratricopeptide repeat protein [Candidatus Krumholzibacteriota bacterium]
MPQNNQDRAIAVTTLTIAVVILMISSMLSAAVPGAGKQRTDILGPLTLSQLGRELEGARSGSFQTKLFVSREIVSSLEMIKRAGLPADILAEVFFLEGQARAMAGEYETAADRFGEALKRSKGDDFADDAFFARIRNLEAAGLGDEAEKEWKEWSRAFPSSPLSPYARLAGIWNDIRAGRIDEAAGKAFILGSDIPWMKNDRGLNLAVATIEYLGEDDDACILSLERAGESAPALILKGLAFERKGDLFKAAGAYQHLADRYPDSNLQGFALFAKARIFSSKDDYRKAAARLNQTGAGLTRGDLSVRLRYLEALSLFLSGDEGAGYGVMREIAEGNSDEAARARFAMGEMRWHQGRYEDSITEFNRLLEKFFDHRLAGASLYRIARCLDALGRNVEANSTYQAVASGYPYSPEAPAAVYLAGVGLLEQGLPSAAAPYFQLVLDRYWGEPDGSTYRFRSLEHQELAEAALCLLEYSYHQTGDMGLLAGAPHLVLHKMPSSRSRWRAYALLLDADALAAESRFTQAQATLEKLFEEFPDHPAGVKANKLLAWTYAKQGREDLAIETEERMLARYSAQDDQENISAASLTIAHSFFNRKEYEEAVLRYNDFYRRFPEHDDHIFALYQSGLCYLRLGRPGNAAACWEGVVAASPGSPTALEAWKRAGDLYFHTGHYEEARRCFRGLIDNTSDRDRTAGAMVKLASCDYNEGRDEEALEQFKQVASLYPDTPASVEARSGITQALYRIGLEDSSDARLAELVDDFSDSPLAPDAQFEIGMRAYDRGDYISAGGEFRKAIQRFPTYSAADRAWFFMADSYSRADSISLARLAWEEFLAYFEKSEFEPAATFRLGMIRFNEGEYTVAAEDFNAVLEMDADEETKLASIYNLGMCYRILGDYDAAIAMLDRYRTNGVAVAGDNGPDRTREMEVSKLLGEIYEEQKMFEKAAREFARILPAAEEVPSLQIELNYHIGYCRERMGDPEKALAAYIKAVDSEDKTDPFRISAVIRSAALHEKKMNFKNALIAYRDIIRHTDDPDLIGAARERVAQIEEALK